MKVTADMAVAAYHMQLALERLNDCLDSPTHKAHLRNKRVAEELAREGY